MDFTGTSGRVVQDPDEARAIEQNEGKQWKKRWRPLCRPVPGCTAVRVHGLDRAVHVVQPWFHSGISRDVAGKILREYGAIDGTFIVRESQSTPGSCVLTYLRGGKVYHVQILCVYDNITRCYHYTLDNGRTRFYDLLQLVEFYQLNAGCLATRLTRYIQCETLGPEPEPQQENEGASAPRPPPTNQNASPKNKGPQPPNNGSAGI